MAELPTFANIHSSYQREWNSSPNCWGFIDGTVRPISCPGRHQRVLYNSHKKEFQSTATPNGLIANLHGPMEGKRHYSAMLAQSQVLNQLQCLSFSRHGDILCTYGDPAYTLSPFHSARLTDDQKAWNKSLSEVRVSVEWIFGDVVNYFKSLGFKKNLKICLSAISKTYISCAVMHNALGCLYGSTTSEFFQISPPPSPAIQEYPDIENVSSTVYFLNNFGAV